MERLRRVASVWSWLPAFRAVAETQHLPTASAELEVSASALSRTIRLLETDLGQALFERQGRRIVLNETGERLLVAVRDAMRRVHDGMSVVDSATLSGSLYIASTNAATDLVVTHALGSLQEHAPGIVPQLRPTPPARLAEALLQGTLDVAFTTTPRADANLTRVALGELPASVYAPAGHPAATARRFSAAQHPFVVWGQQPDGTTVDGWPPSLERPVAAVVTTAAMAHALAVRIGALVVLPRAQARAAVERGELVELRTKLNSTPVFALHRHSLLPGGRAETLVELARSAVAGGLQ